MVELTNKKTFYNVKDESEQIKVAGDVTVNDGGKISSCYLAFTKDNREIGSLWLSESDDRVSYNYSINSEGDKIDIMKKAEKVVISLREQVLSGMPKGV